MEERWKLFPSFAIYTHFKAKFDGAGLGNKKKISN